MPADTIIHRLFEQARVRPDAPAIHVRAAEGWRATTWATYVSDVRRCARALIAAGLRPGETTCILGFNRPEWAIFDLATMAAGGAPAGIYTTSSPSEVQYIVHHAESPVVLLEDAAQWEKVRSQRANLPHLRRVVMMKGAPPIDDPLVQSWEAFLATGDAVPESEVDARVAALKDDDLATLIYTSGTTGPPKGVMLSHRNLAWTAGIALSIVDLGPSDRGLSYLPLSHIAEQMFTLHVPITCGAQVYFAENLAKMPDNLKEVQPTLFFGVPRIWEKFHSVVSGRLAAATGFKAAMAKWARSVATRVQDGRMRGAEPGALLAVQYRIAQKLVFSKLKPLLGLGSVRFSVSGAAPIGREVLEFMASLDVPILEVYGQSEGTGPTSFNQPGRARYGTVGPAIPGVEIRFGEDGEILAKGPNIFLGYFRDPAATAEALRDGWLYSGDLGALDADGFLTITGRKKEILITAGGKNIAPKNIEAAVKNLDLVGECVVIGDRRKFLSALITLDPEKAAARAKGKGIAESAFVASQEVHAEISAGIEVVNKDLAQVEQIKKFTVLPVPFGVETGELTPTLKVKRKVVYQRYSVEIEAMYAE